VPAVTAVACHNPNIGWYSLLLWLCVCRQTK